MVDRRLLAAATTYEQTDGGAATGVVLCWPIFGYCLKSEYVVHV